MVAGVVGVVALQLRARRIFARLGVEPGALDPEHAQQRAPWPLLAVYILMLVQIPLFLVGTSFYSLLNLMTLGLSDASYSAPRWPGALLLTVVLLLASFGLPLALIGLARTARWWALVLVVVTEASVGVIAVVGWLAHQAALFLLPGATLALPILMLLLVPGGSRRHFELG